jgi:hypothetical protein
MEQSTQLIRRSLVVVSLCTSLFVMCIPGLAGLMLSATAGPKGLALLFPWLFGLFGIAGLLRCWRDPEAKSAFSLRADVVLLAIGIIGATIFAAIWLTFLMSSGANPQGIYLLWSFVLAALFPLMPIGLASVEIYKSISLMRTKKLASRKKMRNFYLMLTLVSLVIVVMRIFSLDVVMMWYGRDLVPAAYESAAKLAKGRPYCILGFGGVDTFEEMDKHELLLSAVQKRLTSRNGTTDPHFGIAFTDEIYWWSFKRREFLPLPYSSGNQWRGRWCDALKP